MVDYKQVLHYVSEISEKYRISCDFKKSSAIHKINGDRPVDQQAALFYFLLNEINNSLHNDGSSSLNYRDFRLSHDRFLKLWESLTGEDGTPSPSRLLSDMFWAELPWSDINSQLDGINMVDIGCGKGGYSRKIIELSQGMVSSYRGFDVSGREEWASNTSWAKDRGVDVSFEVLNIDSNVTRFDQCVPQDTNFFMSQSCLEHLEDDLALFSAIKEFISRTDRKCMQVHLIPAPASLGLYLLHGYRQYGKNALVKLADVFRDDGYSVDIYNLCGEMCKVVHRDFITNPIYLDRKGDYRDTLKQDYRMKLKQAAFLDMQAPIEDPIFLAVVIKNF
jgi:SAM-dependent methyltransferase